MVAEGCAWAVSPKVHFSGVGRVLALSMILG